MAFDNLTFSEFLRRFPDDDACLERLMVDRYGLKRVCERCGEYRQFYRMKGRRAYACSLCGHQVSPRAGTIFEKSGTPLRSWFYAMHLYANSRGRIRAREIERALDLNYNTAWRIRSVVAAFFERVGSYDIAPGDWHRHGRG